MDKTVNKDFTFFVELKRVKDSSSNNGNYKVQGIASTPSLDNHKTIFSEQCQMGFVSDVKDPSRKIMFEMEHMGDSIFFNIGDVNDAGLIRTGGNIEFMVMGELYRNHPFSAFLIERLDKGEEKIGLSIRGNVIESHFEDVNGELVRVFDRVMLKKIGITSMPSNTDTYLEVLSRSVGDVVEISKNNLRQELDEKMLANIDLPEVLIERTLQELDKENNMANKLKQAEQVSEQPVAEVVEQVVEATVDEVVTEVADGLKVAEVEQTVESTVVEATEEKVEDIVSSSNSILDKVTSMFESIKSFITDEFKVLREATVARTDDFSNRLQKLEEEISRAVAEVVDADEVVAAKVEEPVVQPNEELETLKRTVEELKSDLVKLSESPSTKPANQIGRSVEGIFDVSNVKTIEDLDKLKADGRITEEVYRNVIWNGFYKSNGLKKLDY